MNRHHSQEAPAPERGREPAVMAGLRVAILGHRGRMGGMLMRRWQEAGISVAGADCDDRSREAGHDRNAIPAEAIREAVAGARAVFLAVPAPVLPSLLDKTVSALDGGAVLADITSVKMTPMRQMERRYAGPVVGTHPLFGPVPLPEDMQTAIVPGGKSGENDIRLVEELFAFVGSRTFRTTAEEHDRGVAYVQGLNFVSSVAYLAALAKRQDVMPFLTPSFRRRLESARKLVIEDGDMFQAFTPANPMIADAMHSYRLFLDLVEGGGLPDVVRRARWWYEPGDEESV